MEETYDVVIVGAGVIGSAIARELARYQLSIAVLEKESDVASGTSKANSGIVHAGFDSKEGSLHAKLNIDGLRMFPDMCRELMVEYREVGSLVVATSVEELAILPKLLARGVANGVQGLRLVAPEELKRMEPNITDEALGALHAPYSGVVSPWELTIAMAECAATAGVRFCLGVRVNSIAADPGAGTVEVSTNRGVVRCRVLVNAAGLHADELARQVGDTIDLEPIKGQEAILDRRVAGLVSHVIFPVPTPISKGMLVSPTAHGNLLIGPTAETIKAKDDFTTTGPGLSDIVRAAQHLVPTVSAASIIASYAGLRATPKSGDFSIGPSHHAPNVIHVAGIKSPGLTAAPAIGVMVTRMARECLSRLKDSPVPVNVNFEPRRPVSRPFREMGASEREAAIAANPLYGHVVCRCETVTEAEIVAAIHSPIPAQNLDSLKRRTRAGSGRCQGSFCGIKLAQILARELHIPIEQVTKRGGDTYLFGAAAKSVYARRDKAVGEL